MNAKQLGRGLGRLLGLIFRPLMIPFRWWFSHNFASGAVVFVLPDSMAIFMVFYGIGFIGLPFWRVDIGLILAFVFLSPAVLLNFLHVKDGRVLFVRTFLCIPYWVVRIPAGSHFEQFEAWEDPAPSGVAFEYGTTTIHLGTAHTAAALDRAIGAALGGQGWRRESLGLTMGPDATQARPRGVADVDE